MSDRGNFPPFQIPKIIMAMVEIAKEVLEYLHPTICEIIN
jgi:hypothetical protein